jgi:hypothetical protein
VRSSRLPLGWSWSFRQSKGFRFEIRDFIIRRHAVPGLVGPARPGISSLSYPTLGRTLALASLRIFFPWHDRSRDSVRLGHSSRLRCGCPDLFLLLFSSIIFFVAHGRGNTLTISPSCHPLSVDRPLSLDLLYGRW